MLQIQVNNEFLDLPPNFSPQFNRFNPVFQTEGIIRDDYTLPIPLPHSDRNARILGNPSVLENETPFRPRFSAKMWWSGMPKISGELRVLKSQDVNIINVHFAYGLSEISADFRERSLRDIMDEEVVIHSTNFDKSIILWYIGVASDFAQITVNGKGYKEDTMEDLIDAINADPDQTAVAEDVSEFVDPITFSYMKLSPGSPSELEPFDIELPPDVVNPTTGVAERSTWKVGNPAWQTTYLETYQDFVDLYRGLTPDRKLRFCTHANIYGFDDNSNLKDFPLVNGYNASGLLQNKLLINFISDPNPVIERVQNQTSLAPQVTLRYIFEKIEDYYDVKILFPLLDEDPDNHLLILSPLTLDVPLTYFNKQKLIFYRRSFNIKEFVPDIPVNEFLKAIQGLGFYIDWDTTLRTITFLSRGAVVSSNQYVDLRGNHSDITDIVNLQKQGVTLSHAVDADDKFVQTPPSPYSGNYDQVYKQGEKKISTRISVPAYDTFKPRPVGLTAIDGVVVSIQQKPEFRTVKLCYQEGNSDALTTHIVNGQSLAWDSQLDYTDGLWEEYWKDWIVMEDNTLTCKATLYMREDWLWKPDWLYKYLIDRSKFLIKSFSVRLEEAEWIEVDAELVRIPYSKRTSLDLGGPIEGAPVSSGFDYDYDFDLD